MLGVAVLLARLTRTPFITILTALPFILPYFRSAEKAQASAHQAMTREEAALILGIAASAGAEDIKDAHRRLIAKNHPDTGGSDYLAAKINQARDVLLG